MKASRYRPSRLLRAILSGQGKLHFSQFGEEGTITRQFPRGFVGTYLDIGAFHPFKWSNTARLWLSGWNGVNIDANRQSIARFERVRSSDRNVWAAVVPASSWRDGQTVNFSGAADSIDPRGAVAAEADGPGVEVPAITLDIVAGYFSQPVDFMNIDIEGIDETVVTEAAFERLSPKVLAIEQYGADIAEIIQRPSSRILLGRGYKMVGRCHITSIYRRD